MFSSSLMQGDLLQQREEPSGKIVKLPAYLGCLQREVSYNLNMEVESNGKRQAAGLTEVL